MKKHFLTTTSLAGLLALSANAADWPTWGGNDSRNMVSTEKGISLDINPGKLKKGTEEVDMATTKGLLWAFKVGSQAYGTPTVANGNLYVGTNNEVPRDPKHQGDRGIVMCIDAKTGDFKWQLVTPKLGAGKVSDWEFLGMCSTPTIIGDRGYVITNRCEVVCLDTKGLADGNQGFQDEGKYMTPTGEPEYKVGPTDADILWVYDMRGELGVFPHNIASSYPLVYDGKVVVSTSNGVDWSHLNLPAPNAPTVIMLNADNGELLAEDGVEISTRVMHCSWSSPAIAKVGDQTQIIFGAGDGWCYGFNPKPEAIEEDGETYHVLKDFWRYDANPPHYRKDAEGKPIKYATAKGPNEIIATPVVYKGKIYTTIGQDPEHGEGVGMFSCLDPNAKGDISGKAVWTFDGIQRSISTPSIVDDLVFACDYSGFVFCLDAKTGEKYWEHDTLGHIWASPMAVDGKVLVGNEEGELHVLAATKEYKEVGTVEFGSPLYGSPIIANGIMYVATQSHVYAFGSK